jgi:hypothetical protein
MIPMRAVSTLLRISFSSFPFSLMVISFFHGTSVPDGDILAISLQAINLFQRKWNRQDHLFHKLQCEGKKSGQFGIEVSFIGFAVPFLTCNIEACSKQYPADDNHCFFNGHGAAGIREDIHDCHGSG